MKDEEANRQEDSELLDGLRGQYVANDRLVQLQTLQRLSEGAHLYVGDQPGGQNSDVSTWTANLGMSKDTFEITVMGRDLKKMLERHLIRYDGTLDEFVLTEDGRSTAITKSV